MARIDRPITNWLSCARAQVAQSEEALAREEAEVGIGASGLDSAWPRRSSPLAVRDRSWRRRARRSPLRGNALRSAELDLNRTSIRAPFTGRVRERRANVGDYVGPGSPVAVMFDGRMWKFACR